MYGGNARWNCGFNMGHRCSLLHRFLHIFTVQFTTNSAKIEQTIDPDMEGSFFKKAISNIQKGWKRIYNDKKLLRIVFAKSSWNLAGAGLAGVFLVLAGGNITGYGAAFGFGLFFFARGIGTGIGPLIARGLFTQKEKWPSLVGIMVSISGIFYFLVGLTLEYQLTLTVCLIICAHAASGANWVLSTVLTQMWVEDEVRGRVPRQIC